MRLISIHIGGFGKFTNFDLDFKSGLNIIYGENESGKTTIMNFILMMFYGSKSKKKDLSENLRIKYQPWNSSLMGGYIVFEDEGIEYRLERIFRQSKGKDEIKLMENLTGNEVTMINPQEPGEHIFGIGLDTFKKTLFMDAEDLIINRASGDISDRLYNMISTSDEEISAEDSLKLLEKRKYQLKSKSGKSGEIVDLEESIHQENIKLQEAKREEVEKKDIEGKLNRLKDEIGLQELQDRYAKAKEALENAENLNAINLSRKDLENSLEEYEISKAEKFAVLDDNKYQLNKLDEDLEANIHKLDEDKAVLRGYKDRKDQLSKSDLGQYMPNNIRYVLYGSIATFVVALIFAIVSRKGLSYIFTALAIILALIYYLRWRKQKFDILESIEAELKSLDSYILNIEESIEDINNRIASINNRKKDLEIGLAKVEVELDNLDDMYSDKINQLNRIKDTKLFHSIDPRIIQGNKDKLCSLKKDLEDKRASHISLYGGILDVGQGEGEDRILTLHKEYESLNAYSKEKFKDGRYVDEINAVIANLKGKLNLLIREYEDIDLTIAMLDKSFKQLSQDFSPILNSKTQEIFNTLSDGKYDNIMISKDFDINFEDRGNSQVKSWKYLSSGARDQAYISLKFALASLITSQRYPMVLLDDIFLNFDEKRRSQGLKMLENQREFQQVLLFTCHADLVDEVAGNKIFLNNR